MAHNGGTDLLPLRTQSMCIPTKLELHGNGIPLVEEIIMLHIRRRAGTTLSHQRVKWITLYIHSLN